MTEVTRCRNGWDGKLCQQMDAGMVQDVLSVERLFKKLTSCSWEAACRPPGTTDVISFLLCTAASVCNSTLEKVQSS